MIRWRAVGHRARPIFSTCHRRRPSATRPGGCLPKGGAGAVSLALAEIIGQGAAITGGQDRQRPGHAELRQFQVAQFGLENRRLPRGIEIADHGLERNFRMRGQGVRRRAQVHRHAENFVELFAADRRRPRRAGIVRRKVYRPAAPTIFPRPAAAENRRGRRFERRSASCNNRGRRLQASRANAPGRFSIPAVR